MLSYNSNIEDSTFHHPPGVGWSPSLSRERNVSHALLRANIQELTFHQTNYCGSLQTIRWFRRSDLVVIPPFFQERIFVSHSFYKRISFKSG